MRVNVGKMLWMLAARVAATRPLKVIPKVYTKVYTKVVANYQSMRRNTGFACGLCWS